MKWLEVMGLSEGALLIRIGSERRAVFCEANELTRNITIKYLDARFPELANPAEFLVAPPPKNTVARNAL